MKHPTEISYDELVLESINITADEYSKLGEIEELLNRVGVTLAYKRKRNGGYSLDLTINASELEAKASKNSRGAGRSPKYLNSITIAEVVKMRETMTDKQIAEQLGISLPTFYRRLKKHEKDIKEKSVEELPTWTL